ncbi:uncharacterized protein isoform X1 [Leptinotarsa decemlineata]|uniref:uncharacterized protein isoform X1 n=1 Tax=Leptinotarsa decemlineata TaxID=7539 RepID=UPI003D3075A4
MSDKKPSGHHHVCAVRNCYIKGYNSKKKFYRFPKDANRARIWAMKANREDLFGKLIDLHRSYSICEIHFEEKMFTSHFHTRLVTTAIPTLFPSLEGTSRTDHSYSAPPLQLPAKILLLDDNVIVPGGVPSPLFDSDIKTECDETAGENEIVENKDDFWTFSETSALVEAYGHHIKSFAEDGHELPTWSRISTELSSKNIHRSPESCERKWESLVQKHNRGQTNYESDDVSNALVETAEQSSKRHKGDCECYERKIVAKQKRHRERMDLIKRKLEIEERKLAAFEKYLAHLSTGKE